THHAASPSTGSGSFGSFRVLFVCEVFGASVIRKQNRDVSANETCALQLDNNLFCVRPRRDQTNYGFILCHCRTLPLLRVHSPLCSRQLERWRCVQSLLSLLQSPPVRAA